MAGLEPVYPDTAEVLPNGHLSIGGCDTVALSATYGTPLYVYDERTIRSRMSRYRDGLRRAYASTSLVCYASKAYCAPWLLELVRQENLGLDVVSGGEIYVASVARFPPERTFFHGNNKSAAELSEALRAGIGRIVVDNLEEITRLAGAAKAMGRRQQVLLRVTPGVEAHTHEHIKTGILDTKFGANLQTGAAEQAVACILDQPSLDLLGLHAHIGSQIFDVDPYRETVRRVLEFAARMRQTYSSFNLREISPGGGFGMRYLPQDDPPEIETVTRAVADVVTEQAIRFGFSDPLPTLTIEPGRSIVGPAAVALYQVGSVKEIPGVRTYVAVDGGIADNIRPATYGAVYTALLANRADEQVRGTYAIAGKYCESGDILIRDVALPPPRIDDLVAIPASGAYQLAMSSNYNMALRPAVIVVNNGQHRLVTRRETYQDLLLAQE